MSLSVLKERGKCTGDFWDNGMRALFSFLLSIICTLNISHKLKKALKGGAEGTLAWRLGTQGWHSGEVLGTLLDLHTLGLNRICQLPLTGTKAEKPQERAPHEKPNRTSAEGLPGRSEHRQHLPLEIEEKLRFLP